MKPPLEDISYLLLQGSHDADVSYLLGARQFRRVSFSGTGPEFKSLIYIDRANHSQFNTEWGRVDAGMPKGHLLNTAPLLAAEQQRRIAEVFISAFLEVTLHDDERYRSMFRDHRTSADWLPNTGFITQYQDSTFHTIADFEEDIDVTTASLHGGKIHCDGIQTWREENLQLRGGGSQHNQVVRIGWRQQFRSGGSSARGMAKNAARTTDRGPSFEVILPANSTLDCNSGAAIVFDLMDATEASNESSPLDFTVSITDRDGETASLRLSQFRLPVRPFTARFTKPPYIGRIASAYASPTDNVLQSYALPLLAFANVNSEFDPSRLAGLQFRFDQTMVGMVLFDDLGVAMLGSKQ